MRLSRTLWRFLTSTRLTVLLLVAMVVALVLASLFPQMPPDPAARAPWLEAVALRYRQATGLIRSLGLFEAFRAPWFLVLLAALLLNLLACTVQRLPRLWRSLVKPPNIARPEAFFRGSARRREWPVTSLQDGLAAVEQALRAAPHRYRLHTEKDESDGCTYVYGVRGRWTQAGTLVSHVATAVLLVAVAARPVLGWQETGVMLLPGQAHSIGGQQPLTVRAGSLSVGLYPGGQPREYRVPLAVVVHGSPVMTQTVRINHPLNYRGVSFHLQGYGPAVRVSTAEDIHHLALAGGQAQEMVLPEADIILRVAHQPAADVPDAGVEGSLFVEARTADGTVLGSGSVFDEQEIEVQGRPLKFTLDTYTVWQASRDPTFGPAVVAAGLLLVALFVSLLKSHRRLWIRANSQVMQMVGVGDFNGDFDELADQMARACRPHGPVDG